MILEKYKYLNIIYCIISISLWLPSLLNAQIQFQESALQWNLQHHLLEQTIGGGVSVYDFNKDGLDDLTLATDKGRKLGFYINTGSNFEPIPPLVDNEEQAKQILWADYDNDGDADLFVVGYWGYNHLYRNDGNLIFVDVTIDAQLPLEVQEGYGACWGDYNRDGWLDLLCNFRTYAGQERGGNRLFKNNANGTFTEVTLEAKVGNENRMPFASTFFDYNNDQWPDIYTANDKLTLNTLYENVRNGTFWDASDATGAGVRMNAMCSNTADMNNDGWADIYITNTPVGSKCLVNSGPQESIFDITFEDHAVELGISYEGGTGWASNYFDADNDGDFDLYLSGNGIDPIVKGIHFYENIDLQYFEVRKEGFEKDTTSSFTNAIGDFNQDGRLDILVQNSPPFSFYLWENRTDNNHNWLKLRLEGIVSNRDAIGTRIECYALDLYQYQFTHCGFGFLGQNSNVHHFGLNGSAMVDSLIITWSSGHIDRFYNIEPNQIINIIEGQTTNGQINIDKGLKIIERPLSTSSQETFIFSTDMQLSPNPTTHSFNINTDLLLIAAEIWTMEGKQVARYPSEIVDQNSISVDFLPKGIYLLKVEVKNGGWYTQKFIKL